MDVDLLKRGVLDLNVDPGTVFTLAATVPFVLLLTLAGEESRIVETPCVLLFSVSTESSFKSLNCSSKEPNNLCESGAIIIDVG